MVRRKIKGNKALTEESLGKEKYDFYHPAWKNHHHPSIPPSLQSIPQNQCLDRDAPSLGLSCPSLSKANDGSSMQRVANAAFVTAEAQNLLSAAPWSTIACRPVIQIPQRSMNNCLEDLEPHAQFPQNYTMEESESQSLSSAYFRVLANDAPETSAKKSALTRISVPIIPRPSSSPSRSRVQLCDSDRDALAALLSL